MKIKLKKLKSGLRILTIPMKDNQTTTVLALVGTGSKSENKENNGISHFLEHMCFKGTESRTSLEITRELDSLGAQSNAFTGQEYTGYYAKGSAKKVYKFIDIISDIYLNSILPEEEMEKEKGVIIGEIDMYEDLPMYKVDENFVKLLYGDQPAGRTILGSKKNIKKMKREDFLEYRNKFYVAENIVFVVSGGIDSKKVEKEIERKFKNISTKKKAGKKKVIEKQSSPAIHTENKKTDQTHLILGFRGFKKEHKTTTTLNLLSVILGKGMSSRLFVKLREEMAAGYYVRADYDTLTDSGVFNISAGVHSNLLNDVVKAILGECEWFNNNLVSEKELKKSKEFLIGNMKLSLESSDSLAVFYGKQEVLYSKIKNQKEIEKEIRKTTAKDIKRVSNLIFKNDKLNLAILGPINEKKEKEIKKILMIG